MSEGDPGRLLVISGLPGVGKTTVAERITARLGAVHVSVDVVEEALLGAGLEPGWTTGVAAYEAARAVVEANLRLGHRVVVDAVNDSEPAHRPGSGRRRRRVLTSSGSCSSAPTRVSTSRG